MDIATLLNPHNDGDNNDETNECVLDHYFQIRDHRMVIARMLNPGNDDDNKISGYQYLQDCFAKVTGDRWEVHANSMAK